MERSLLEITEKYLELISKGNPRYVLERLYLWEYGFSPCKYYLSRGKISSTLINLTNKEELEDPKYTTNEYDIQELFKSLRKSKNYIGVLDTPYDDGTNSDDYIIIMKDAIIRIGAILFPNISKYGKELWIYTHKDPNDYAGLVKWKLENPNNLYFYFLSQTPSGKLIEKKMELPKMEIDIEKNYNSDLPLSGIREFIESSTPGLVIFNGEPGTGKSSFLKYLITQYSSKNWVIIPSKVLLNCREGNLVDYFMKDKDRIYILEDCEKLILRREKGNNLEIFLNLTDGLIGDALYPRFICTFNTPISNIDPALLRKGRLKLRYEFGPLSLEKTKDHIPEATSPMTLADIYNRGENGGEIQRKKIGY